MRRRIVVLVAAMTTMVALSFLVPLAIVVRDLAASRALTAAERDAASLARTLAVLVPVAGADQALGLVGEVSSSGFPQSVVDEEGRAAGVSPLPGEDLAPAFAGAGYRQSVPGGQVVYAPIVLAEGTLVVRVFVPESALREGVVRSWVVLTGLGIVLIGLALLVAERLARSIVRPVEEVAETASLLGDGDLSARVRPSGPEEVERLGQEVNRLAERIIRLLQIERENAADLSHRLRTPLTALRLDAEALEPGPRRERLLDDLDALERTVDFVIREARRPVRQETGGECDLAEVVRDRVGFWRALAEEQGRDVGASWPETAPVPVPRADAEALVDALLGNVFAHTPEGADLRVTVVDGEKVSLLVEDAGPGFSPEAVERGRSGADGTGLGLDIARRTAVAAGGSLRIDRSESLGGARVTVVLRRGRG